jgi:RimJ/RimL family protein N-acetyltransferase
MDKWDPIAPVLEGTLVRVEPLDERHKAGLRAAGGDPAIWRWMPLDAGASDAQFERWWADAVEHNAARTEAVFVIVEREKDIVVGSTRYCALSPEHRALEIGWTWLAPAAWRSGINLETKLLLLGYAFEELGCIRVELKTDALNERSRAAIAGIGACRALTRSLREEAGSADRPHHTTDATRACESARRWKLGHRHRRGWPTSSGRGRGELSGRDASVVADALAGLGWCSSSSWLS